MRKFLLFLIFLLIFIQLSESQTQLLPGETIIEIVPINLTKVDDYTREPQLIGLFGNISYLLISWNANYSWGLERDIGVICYLNCPNLTNEDITVTCAGIQNCTYVGLPGLRRCAILSPNYFYDQSNTVACKFYDPADPTILFITREGKPYIQRNFDAMKYDIEVTPVKVSVGETFLLPIKITNFGLLESFYQTSINTLQPNVLIEDKLLNTGSISYGESTATYPKIRFLTADTAIFTILVNSSSDLYYCKFSGFYEECQYLKEDNVNGICLSNRCHKIIEDLAIEAGEVSLSDFSILQLLLALPIVCVIYIFILKRARK